jgi:hypothetical protein
MKHLSRRSVTTGALAAVTMIPAVGLSVGAKATNAEVPAEDAELRRLWAEYLVQLRLLKDREVACSAARMGFDAEFPPCPEGVLPGHHWDAYDWLWRKYGLHRLYSAMNREHRKLIKITKAIRKTKAETLFGVGVKLSVSECFEEADVVEAAEDARRANRL